MDLYIVGAGGAGREVLDACLAAGRPAFAFLDEYRAGETVRGLPVLALDAAPAGSRYVLAIADPHARRRLADLFDGRDLDAESVQHPRALVAPESSVGPGSILLANAYVSSSVNLGRHCQVHYNATIGHDSQVADFVTVYPGANVSGSVDLGQGATIGSNAVVLQGRSVGADAFVGAGAVVTRDVAAATVVVGAPARPLYS